MGTSFRLTKSAFQRVRVVKGAAGRADAALLGRYLMTSQVRARMVSGTANPRFLALLVTAGRARSKETSAGESFWSTLRRKLVDGCRLTSGK